jgi:predicted dehydrogenase
MKGIGDIDHAAISLTFESGALGSVELSRSAVFGYDIRAEIWGTKGTLQVGYFRETPVLTMTREGITHDAVPHFMERFEKAYLVQIQDFVDRVREGREPAITGADAIAALRVSVAANKSLRENRAVSLAELEHATFTQAV